MSRTRQNIKVLKVKRIGKGAAAVTISGDVSSGPAGTVGRTVDFFLADTSMAFIFGTLAGMPAYRDVFRAIADELDSREMSAATDPAPVTRLANKLNSHETSSAIRRIVGEAVNAALLREG